MRCVHVAVLAAVAVTSCYESDFLPVAPDPLELLVPVHPESARERDDVDLLIVMDNSGSMSEEQAALAAHFPRLLEDLFHPPDRDGDGRTDGWPIESLNVGVVSTDMGSFGYTISTCGSGLTGYAQGDDGCLRNTPSPSVAGCTDGYPAFLSRDAADEPAYSVEALGHDVACLATLGTTGCGWEQPLKAARRALTEQTLPGGCNLGFLRHDSLLLVLWVTDEDDASISPEHPELLDTERTDLGHLGDIRILMHPDWLVPVEEYVEAFRTLETPEEPRVLLAVIAGVPPDEPLCIGRGDDLGDCLAVPAMRQWIDVCCSYTPSCSTEMGLAQPPVRYVRLAQAWGARAYVDSSCESDWRPAMERIAAMVGEHAAARTCWPELALDPTTCNVPGCHALLTLPDDAACPADPDCPADGCPPVGPDDLVAPRLDPCVNPTTGDECEPLLRDLGLGPGPDGAGDRVRRCLVRQSPRPPAGADGCGPPSGDGWYFVPGAAGDHGCAEVLLEPAHAPWMPLGARLELRCAAPAGSSR
ncbi:MAG: hypothetical protein JXB32_05340 [Deltaproteobacteria bacterium]|nr:hypothetical protein [Deltaproteobacteria bacterium]